MTIPSCLRLGIIAGLLGWLLPFSLLAQSGIHPSGGDLSQPEGTLTYSVGQVWVQSATGLAYSLQEGVQQPFEIQLMTDQDPSLDLRVTFQPYPNPTLDLLWLQAEGLLPPNLTANLTTLQGQVLFSQAVNSASTQFSLQHLTEGVYLLYLLRDEQPVKTFKIIKN